MPLTFLSLCLSPITLSLFLSLFVCISFMSVYGIQRKMLPHFVSAAFPKSLSYSIAIAVEMKRKPRKRMNSESNMQLTELGGCKKKPEEGK